MSNEEKILALLEKMERTQEKHGEILEQHGKMLEQHGKLLEQHSRALEQLRGDVTGVKVRLDLEVSKQLSALAEGQETLLETLASKERVEAVEDDIVLLKSTTKAINREIAELKKAQ